MPDGTRTDSALLAFSLLAAAYFGFLALDAFVFRLVWIVLGVTRELLTMPLILGVAAGFVFSMIRLLANRRALNSRKIGTALILVAVNCLIWGL